MKSDSVVIIPTYNEKENIEAIVREVLIYLSPFIFWLSMTVLRWYSFHCKKLQKEFPSALHLEERKGKLGLGTA